MRSDLKYLLNNPDILVCHLLLLCLIQVEISGSWYDEKFYNEI